MEHWWIALSWGPNAEPRQSQKPKAVETRSVGESQGPPESSQIHRKGTTRDPRCACRGLRWAKTADSGPTTSRRSNESPDRSQGCGARREDERRTGQSITSDLGCNSWRSRFGTQTHSSTLTTDQWSSGDASRGATPATSPWCASWRAAQAVARAPPPSADALCVDVCWNGRDGRGQTGTVDDGRARGVREK